MLLAWGRPLSSCSTYVWYKEGFKFSPRYFQLDILNNKLEFLLSIKRSHTRLIIRLCGSCLKWKVISSMQKSPRIFFSKTYWNEKDGVPRIAVHELFLYRINLSGGTLEGRLFQCLLPNSLTLICEGDGLDKKEAAGWLFRNQSPESSWGWDSTISLDEQRRVSVGLMFNFH